MIMYGIDSYKANVSTLKTSTVGFNLNLLITLSIVTDLTTHHASHG